MFIQNGAGDGTLAKVYPNQHIGAQSVSETTIGYKSRVDQLAFSIGAPIAYTVTTDEIVLINTRLLQNEGYFSSLLMPLVINGFDKVKIDLDPDAAKFINVCVAKEYMSEYKGIYI